MLKLKKATLSAALVLLVMGAATATAAQRGGGLLVPGAPEIRDVMCLSGCQEIRKSSPGGMIQVSGRNLQMVTAISFSGRKGRTRVEPSSKTATSVEAKVPEGAVSGRVRVIGSSGNSSASDAVLEIGPPPEPAGSPLRVSDASTTPAVAYQYGKSNPRLSFVATGGSRVNDLRVDVAAGDGQVVFTRVLRGVPSGSTQSVAWNGRVRGGGIARNGSYRFVVRGLDGTRARVAARLTRKRAKSSSSSEPFSFRIYGFMFPVRGPHHYGDGIGAGRGHQGTDIMARCGTPLVAARGGTVFYNSYQAGGAGHYLVINLAGTRNQSHVYMHLARPSPHRVGSSVRTGELIGVVGTTGRSTACHLHFEHWSSPGWYQGGTFLDPTGALKRWNRYR